MLTVHVISLAVLAIIHVIDLAWLAYLPKPESWLSGHINVV